MRYIDFDSFKPTPEWQEKARLATEELMTKTSMSERLAYIKSKSQVWRDLREELMDKFGKTCWFTDAEETVAHLDVEHFRPKAEALDEDSTEHEGYWWLAFDYNNFRLAGQIPNRQHKRCYFPLLPGCVRATSNNPRWQEELPVFLDPINAADVELVAYNEAGQMCASSCATTGDEKLRVEVTDRLLGLSTHSPLVEARQRTWTDCRGIIERIHKLKDEERKFAGATARTIGERKTLMQELYKMTRPDRPFSSVAKSCLIVSGYDWAIRLSAL